MGKKPNSRIRRRQKQYRPGSAKGGRGAMAGCAKTVKKVGGGSARKPREEGGIRNDYILTDFWQVVTTSSPRVFFTKKSVVVFSVFLRPFFGILHRKFWKQAGRTCTINTTSKDRFYLSSSPTEDQVRPSEGGFLWTGRSTTQQRPVVVVANTMLDRSVRLFFKGSLVVALSTESREMWEHE